MDQGPLSTGETTVVVDRDVMVPARDGVRLATDVYRADADRPLPTIVMRTPYGKTGIGPRYHAAEIAGRGYVVVVQDVRGTSSSEGSYADHGIDGPDGYDCVEWVAAQPWSTGRVGMYGASAMAATQWEAAQQAPPHLVAIAPEVIAWDTTGRTGFLLEPIGMFAVHMARTELAHQRGTWDPEEYAARLRGLDEAVRDPRLVLDRLPLSDQPLLEGVADFFFARLAEAGHRSEPTIDYSRIRVPAFVIAGWHDFTLPGSLNQYAGMRDRAATDEARDGTRLVVGPYYHGLHGEEPDDRPEGWLDVAGGASARVAATQDRWLAWMDPYLRGAESLDRPTSRDHLSTARVYTMGRGVWQDLPVFPPEDTTEQTWYLRAGGRLALQPPDDEPPDAFDYDPLDPVPTRGGAMGGVFDQRPLLQRPDVLVYASDPLEHGTEVTGRVWADLTVSSSAPDTDLTAMLLDLHPDGVAQNVVDNLLRLRFRDGPDPRPLEPGTEVEVRIDLAATSTWFAPGHRIGLAVSSSSFPQWDRNPNTGAPLHSGPETAVARQRVFHDAARPSSLTLPLRTTG